MMDFTEQTYALNKVEANIKELSALAYCNLKAILQHSVNIASLFSGMMPYLRTIQGNSSLQLELFI
jgi:hypothetical protein